MGVLVVPETAEAAERRKWEAQYSPYGPGERPYIYREFPLMLHKAGKPLDKDGNPKLGAAEIIETKTVASLDEETRENANGFYRNPADAVQKFKAQEVEIAKLAAEIEYEKARKLSPEARAEVEAAQNAFAGHMPMVPETAVRRRVSKAAEGASKLEGAKKRGRPRNAAKVAAETAKE